MGDHVSSQMSNWQCLLLVVAFAALGNGLEVGSQGFVDAIETLDSLAIIKSYQWHGYSPSCLTFISVSIALKSSVKLVLTSLPILSPAHCLKRSNFLFIMTDGWILWIRLRNGIYHEQESVL